MVAKPEDRLDAALELAKEIAGVMESELAPEGPTERKQACINAGTHVEEWTSPRRTALVCRTCGVYWIPKEAQR